MTKTTNARRIHKHPNKNKIKKYRIIPYREASDHPGKVNELVKIGRFEKIIEQIF